MQNSQVPICLWSGYQTNTSDSAPTGDVAGIYAWCRFCRAWSFTCFPGVWRSGIECIRLSFDTLRLKTSETRLNLDHLFVYLSTLHHEGRILLSRNSPELFGDMPGLYTFKHGIDVWDTGPIKQRLLGKCSNTWVFGSWSQVYVRKQYCRAFSFQVSLPYFLVPKPHITLCFGLNLRKVNAVLKPDFFHYQGWTTE